MLGYLFYYFYYLKQFIVFCNFIVVLYYSRYVIIYVYDIFASTMLVPALEKCEVVDKSISMEP